MGQSGASRFCGHCGAPNNAVDLFCANCGYALAQTGSTQTNFPTVAATPPPAASPGGRRVTGGLVGGQLLYNRYRIVQLVGKGGFGAVYKALDEHFKVQRAVAIKELSEAQLGPGDRSQAIQDFRQEAELLVPLQHRNLPDIKDFFEDSGSAYLVMEFIEGQTLQEALEVAHGPLPEGQVMGWALQLCDVLNYLHTQPQPIIFRDLKPSNIMVTTHDQIKLIDFGIARIFKSNATRDTATLGSRGYAPMEQYGQGQSDERTDIYALGATLYEALTNTTPLDAVMRKISPTGFEPPRQLNPAISEATERIILKAMEMEPTRRFQSAIAMARAIQTSGNTTPANTNTGTHAALTQTSAASQPQTILSPTLAARLSSPPPPPPPPPLPSPSPAAPRSTGASAGGQSQMATPQLYTPAPAKPAAPQRQPAPAGQPPQQGTGGMSRRRFVGLGLGVVILGAAGAGGYYIYEHQFAAPPTVTIQIAYSTEKDTWLLGAIQAFNQSNQVLASSQKLIQVVPLPDSGSLDIANQILSGSVQPIAWTPASELELNFLNYKWAQKHNGQDIVVSSGNLAQQSLVSSPLIFAAWQNRARTLLTSYGSIDWDSIYRALQAKTTGGNTLYLGHTLPGRSNSGLLTLMLMAYAYAAKTFGQPALTIAQTGDPTLWNYIQVFENAVYAFGKSSETYFREDVIASGPTTYGITITYENLVLQYHQQAQSRGNEPLQIFYPQLNAISTHPFAIFQAPWVTSEQQEAARQFRDFLLGETQQRAALQYGFRPSDPTVALTDGSVANNPFQQLRQLAPLHTFNVDTDARARPPDGNVVEALITQWEHYYPNPPLGNG